MINIHVFVDPAHLMGWGYTSSCKTEF